MSIDDKICRDPRITVLAQAIGWTRRETVGCLILEVWPICYDQESHVISERIIDAAASHPGFAQAMIDCELATRDRSGRVRISGAKERIEYLNHKKRSGREGGLKSAISRAKGVKQTSSTGGSTPQAAGNPSVPDLPSASASASVDQRETPPAAGLTPLELFKVKVDAATGDIGKARNKRAAKVEHPDRARVIDAFHQRFKLAYGGKPTWDGKTVGQVGQLLQKHSADTLIARIEFMFAGKAKWPPPPYTLDVFVRNIDAWVDTKPPTPIRRIEEL